MTDLAEQIAPGQAHAFLRGLIVELLFHETERVFAAGQDVRHVLGDLGTPLDQPLECLFVEPIALDRGQRDDRRGSRLPGEQPHFAEEISVVQAPRLTLDAFRRDAHGRVTHKCRSCRASAPRPPDRTPLNRQVFKVAVDAKLGQERLDLLGSGDQVGNLHFQGRNVRLACKRLPLHLSQVRQHQLVQAETTADTVMFLAELTILFREQRRKVNRRASPELRRPILCATVASLPLPGFKFLFGRSALSS